MRGIGATAATAPANDRKAAVIAERFANRRRREADVDLTVLDA
jgi:hypothetical protein